MLGWHISVYRQLNGGAAPASFDTISTERLAVWQTGLDGLDWIDQLAKTNEAISLGGSGYPLKYTAIAPSGRSHESSNTELRFAAFFARWGFVV